MTLDEQLKKLLTERPDLMAKLLSKQPGGVSPTSVGNPTNLTSTKSKEPKKYKAPYADYRLSIFTGCITCLTITETGFFMSWDAEKNCFRPRNLGGSLSAKAFIETKKQTSVSITCNCCISTLSKQTPVELTQLILKLQNPIEMEKRESFLKQQLREA